MGQTSSQGPGDAGDHMQASSPRPAPDRTVPLDTRPVDSAACTPRGLSRRDFLGMLGVAAGLPAVVPVILRPVAVDLDAVDAYVSAAIAATSSGAQGKEQLIATMARVAELYAHLHQLPLSPRDGRVAGAYVRTGTFLAALQETVLPWQGSRVAVAAGTYGDLLREVFAVSQVARSAPVYVQVALRRATLLREVDHLRTAEHDLYRVQDDARARDFPDARLPVAFRCQIVHTLAVEGRTAEWERELTQVQEFVERVSVEGPIREELRAIVRYTEGVGYKRFMWQLRALPHSPARQHYATRAATILEGLLHSEAGVKAAHNVNAYHASVPLARAQPELESSIIDALVWCDPAYALHRAALLRERLEQVYPSLLAKLDAQVALAQRRLGTKGF